MAQSLKSIGVRAALLATVGLAVASVGPAAYAEEGGTWRGLAVLVETSSKAVDVADQENHSVVLQEYDGVVFNDNDDAFLDKARYQVVNVTDTGGMADGGYKTFTADDGSQVFARYKLMNAAPPVLKGEWEFIGGTGQYQGITGSGTYTVQIVADTVLWDLLEGEYKLP